MAYGGVEQVGVPVEEMGVRGGHQPGASTRDVVELKKRCGHPEGASRSKWFKTWAPKMLDKKL